MPRRTAFDPVQYSASTRKTIARLEEQIKLTERHLDLSRPDDFFATREARTRHVSDCGKILGLAIALVQLAEQHRRWDDAERWGAIQGRYAHRVSDLVYGRTPAVPLDTLA